MGKIKSTVALILATILIVGLCFMCTVSFSYGTDGMHTFNSVVSMLQKDYRFGDTLADGETYLGGGYTAVYYPEGVISVQEYKDNLDALTDADEVEEYEEKYKPYPVTGKIEDQLVPEKAEEGKNEQSIWMPRLYIEKEKLDENGDPTEAFKAEFGKAVAVLRERVGGLRDEGARVAVRDDYTVEVSVSSLAPASLALTYFSYFGGLDIAYGSDEASAESMVGKKETIGDYVTGFSSASRGGTAYVQINFTDAGKQKLTAWTADAAENGATLYVNLGDQHLISLTVSSAITDGTLYISGSYTADSARVMALTLDTALKGGVSEDFTFTVGNAYRTEGSLGDGYVVDLYIIFAFVFVAMLVVFFVRYRALGFVHLYTFLLWFFLMIVLLWGLPALGLVSLHLGIESFFALMFGALLLSVCNAVSFESARKDYANGKTMAASVKAGYKRIFLPVLDVHVILALFAFITYFIALTELSVFAFTLGLGVVLSALCTLAVNRFFWACMMSLSKDQGKFCHFKREETEDD